MLRALLFVDEEILTESQYVYRYVEMMVKVSDESPLQYHVY